MPVPGRPRATGGTQPRFHRGNTRRADVPLTRFHETRRVFVARPGMTPGVQGIDRGADQSGGGTIRRLWRQAVNFIAAPPPFSWTQNPPIITRALRYKASTVFRGAGSSNTRFGARRPHIVPRHTMPRVTLAAGNVQGRPAIRNRLSSFGSRVPTVNRPSRAAKQGTG
jgi:hypothetical protein